MKILDITAKKRAFNGGIMKITDIITLYKQRTSQVITKSDIEQSLKTINVLGSGCCIFKKEYVCTVPFELSEDSSELMAIAEEVNNYLINRKDL